MDPAATALLEMPELDFALTRVRRNPYAARMAREAIEIVHEQPTPDSLAAIPEVDFAAASRNPYAERLARDLQTLGTRRGRPRAGEEIGPTAVRSIRLPERVWLALEAEAATRKLTVHALLRAAIARLLDEGHGPVDEPRRGRARRARR